ncbi:unnamed protein product [Closterium sp. NIES-54]
MLLQILWVSSSPSLPLITVLGLMSSLLADLTPGCLWALSPVVPWLPTAITVLAVPADVPWLPTLVACPSVCSRLLSPLCLPPFLRYHDSRPSWSAASLRGPWQFLSPWPFPSLPWPVGPVPRRMPSFCPPSYSPADPISALGTPLSGPSILLPAPTAVLKIHTPSIFLGLSHDVFVLLATVTMCLPFCYGTDYPLVSAPPHPSCLAAGGARRASGTHY